MMEDFEYVLLLSKRFSREITPAEDEQLKYWLSMDPNNAALAKEYEKIWAQTGAYTTHVRVDVPADFAKVQRRIRSERQAPPRRGNVALFPYLRVAAALLFLMLGYAGYRQWFAVPEAELVQIEAANDNKVVLLEDGTKIWLRKDARVEYPKNFAAANRKVRLFGDAYFDVTQKANQPFIVEMEQGGVVQVLGTRFSITSNLTEETVTVLVKEGKVQYNPEKNHAGATLTARRKATFNRKARKILISEVTSFNELAWQSGGLEFINHPLAQTMNDLEQYYNVQLELRNPALQACPFTSPLLKGQSVDQVLQLLHKMYQVEVRHTPEGAYVLEGGSCQ
jgi:transmembrane sensor